MPVIENEMPHPLFLKDSRYSFYLTNFAMRLIKEHIPHEESELVDAVVNALQEREELLFYSGSDKMFEYTPPVVAIRRREDGSKDVRTWNFAEYDFCTIAKAWYELGCQISDRAANVICNSYAPEFTEEVMCSNVYFLNQKLRESCGEELCNNLVVSVLKGEVDEWMDENRWMFDSWFLEDKSRFVVMTDHWAAEDAHYKKWNPDKEDFSDDAGFDMVTVLHYSGRSDRTSVPSPIVIPKSVAYALMKYLLP